MRSGQQAWKRYPCTLKPLGECSLVALSHNRNISLAAKDAYDKDIISLATFVEADRDRCRERADTAERNVLSLTTQLRDRGQNELLLQQSLRNVKKQLEECAGRERLQAAEITRLNTLVQRYSTSHVALTAQLEKATAESGVQRIAAMKVEHENDIKKLKETHAALIRRNNGKMAEIQKSQEDEVAKARAATAGNDQRVRDLEQQQADLRFELQAAEKKWAEEKAGVERDMFKLAQKLKEEEDGAKASVETLKKELAESRAEVERKTAAYAKLEDDTENALEKAEEAAKIELEQAREESKAQIEEVEAKVGAAEHRAKEAEARSQAANGRAKEAVDKLQESQKALESAAGKLMSSTALKAALEERVKALNKDVGRLAALDKTIEQKDQTIAERERTIAKLESTLNTEGEMRMAEKKKIRATEGDKRNFEETIARLNKVSNLFFMPLTVQELNQSKAKIAELAAAKDAEHAHHKQTPVATRAGSPVKRQTLPPISTSRAIDSLATANAAGPATATGGTRLPVSPRNGQPTTSKRVRSPAPEPLFLPRFNDASQESPVKKKARFPPAVESIVKEEENVSRSSTPMLGPIPPDVWIASHMDLLVNEYAPFHVRCKVCQ